MKTLSVKTRLRSAMLLAALSCCVLMQAQTVTTLHNFTGCTTGDGSAPSPQNLPMDANGAIYGTTSEGGSTQWGTVFQLVPPANQSGTWTENVIYTFQGYADGGRPQSGLALDAQGNLYGATTYGGNLAACGGGCGTIYELSPPAQPGGAWTHTVLYAFGGGFDGFAPGAVVLGTNGSLFGMTLQGGPQTIQCITVKYPKVTYACGTVYELSPPAKQGGSWTKSILHTFPATTNDGQRPAYSELVFDNQGNLYGVTYTGFSAATQNGIVFQLTPSSGHRWTENILYAFSGGSDGGNPVGLTLGANGAIYGVASTTDASNPNSLSGAVFELTESGGVWTETVLHTFPAFSGDGTQPGSPLTLDSSGNLYGTTGSGGTTNCTNSLGNVGCGTAFKLAPPSGGSPWTETVLENFPNASGTRVVLHNGLLYGTADQLGNEALGLAFSLTP